MARAAAKRRQTPRPAGSQRARKDAPKSVESTLFFNRLRRQLQRLTDAQLQAHDKWAAQVVAASGQGDADEDVRIVRELLEKLQPGQVYVAGDLSDPHGTHRMCAEAIFHALREWRGSETGDGNGTAKMPEVLLYRGAWQEWEPHEGDLGVPLSPSELERKKFAIFKHESQKDAAMYPGPTDSREFWQRAEERNRHTAQLYDQLGLPEYYALEGFVQWKG